ncbi:uncharacterized protein LOC106643412 [Copidosoma floridanum]|uniref:uncharacterized protein LOC106643412 n=1 Tax=Copidosoma floridanum TaxID=29053 RepID=UPI0006C99E3A|nr:uncharacterized protein LOC106643412 [Copidosoma floridanum]
MCTMDEIKFAEAALVQSSTLRWRRSIITGRAAIIRDSQRSIGVMAGPPRAKVLWFVLLFCHRLAAATQYTNDDSDYDDFDFYKDGLPEKRVDSTAYRRPQQDDFYMVGDSERADDPNRRSSSDALRDEPAMSDTSSRMSSRESTNPQTKWPSAERVYRYTKHRIPGYDYEELDFLEPRSRPRRCDERSVYTHCLCQFTCAEPNVVDCYTPCSSGCECREDYVFDEQLGECVLPEQCQPDDDYLLY